MHDNQPKPAKLVSPHLREAEKQLAIALGKLDQPNGVQYIGSLREYKRLVKLYLRLQDITKDVTRGEARPMRRRSFR